MIRWLAAMFLLAAAGPLAAADEDYQSFGEFLEQFRKESGTPSLSAVIIRNDEVVWEGYFGTYDDEGELPTVAETTYKIASVTKPIVATALYSEAFAGRLNLDMPMSSDGRWREICEYFVTTPIPFMKGGIDPHGNPIPPMQCDKPTTLRELLDMRANGDAFVYNPIAFARIDRALPHDRSRTLRDIVRERVVDYSLGLDYDVALGWRDPFGGSALRYLAEPFHVVDGKAVKQPLPDDDFRAAAGIIASPRAIAEIDIFFDQGRILGSGPLRKRLVEMAIGPLGDYRAGWWLEDWEGKRLMWHSGWNEKQYSALYLKVPEERLTLIVMANTEAIYWGNSLVKAEVVNSPIAARFLEGFARSE
ncbi:serine hydrolase domain-containing protein [Parerythrobacter aestuarii]|uniref:serine hydrolase domain-containing protein n=1 Tax=Parerythrobacter aestuarii TaxID=3020909 RepID=UPI0024DE700D|nr:serine hydrolase domain-containing protein [Parerythrobacter aestuarii]